MANVYTVTSLHCCYIRQIFTNDIIIIVTFVSWDVGGIVADCLFLLVAVAAAAAAAVLAVVVCVSAGRAVMAGLVDTPAFSVDFLRDGVTNRIPPFVFTAINSTSCHSFAEQNHYLQPDGSLTTSQSASILHQHYYKQLNTDFYDFTSKNDKIPGLSRKQKKTM